MQTIKQSVYAALSPILTTALCHPMRALTPPYAVVTLIGGEARATDTNEVTLQVEVFAPAHDTLAALYAQADEALAALGLTRAFYHDGYEKGIGLYTAVTRYRGVIRGGIVYTHE